MQASAMAQAHETKKKKKKSTKRQRKERRFVGEQTYASKVAVGVGMLGGLLLGAGVYSRWVSEQPASYAVMTALRPFASRSGLGSTPSDPRMRQQP